MIDPVSPYKEAAAKIATEKAERAKPAPASCSAFVVTGYALIPVEIRMEVSARDESEAGQHAEEFFNNATPATRRSFIVPNSEDDTSVSEFRWSRAERQNSSFNEPSSRVSEKHEPSS